MRLYLFGSTALAIMRHLRAIRDERLRMPAQRLKRITDAMHLKHDIASLSPEAERLLAHADSPAHVLVSEKEKVRSGAAVISHLWSGPLPNGAFLRICKDLYLPTPQFLFLQLARDTGLIDLIKIGHELCGTYSPGKEHAPKGLQIHDDENAEYFLDPLISARRLKSFVRRAAGLHGAKRAAAACSWVLDGAASPMESNVSLLLCLPKRLGGYGLPLPHFNPEVEVRTPGSREKRYPDLYWREESIDVEYQSDYAHSGDWKRYKDSHRQIVLETNRINVLPLTRPQVMNVDDFHTFAIGLARLLGRRVRGFDADWESCRATLRKAILLSNNTTDGSASEK